MKISLKLCLIIVTICLLYSCSIKTVVNPIKDVNIASLCIQENSDVFSKQFIDGLRELIENNGINTKVYNSEKPSDCVYHMEYTAQWGWDVAMYLKYAKLTVFENNIRIGDAEYNAMTGSGQLDKFGRTADKIKPLVDELFSKKTS